MLTLQAATSLQQGRDVGLDAALARQLIARQVPEWKSMLKFTAGSAQVCN